MPDAVVIGAGNNGLVAANTAANAGWSVEVLEEQPGPGGAVRHDRGVDPDFVNDLFGCFHLLAAASPALAAPRLEGHGLGCSHAPSTLAHPLADGRRAVLDRDLDVTAASLDRTERAGRTVDASPEESQYEVRSASSGRSAVHKPLALREK